MTVPRRRDGDARGEVEKQIAVDIFDDGAGATRANERIDARVEGDVYFSSRSSNAFALGPGKTVWIAGTLSFSKIHIIRAP